MTPVHRLTKALDATFFVDVEVEGPAPRWCRTTAARAVLLAFGVLEARVDDLDIRVVATAHRALRGLCTGSMDRARLRLAAGAAMVHVAATIGVDAGTEPLIEVLAALSCLEVDADVRERATDLTPDPDVALEGAMAAACDQGRVDVHAAFASALVHAPVLDLGTDDGSLVVQFLPIVVDGDPTITAFTSPARLASIDDRAARLPTLALPGRELAGLCPLGHGIAVNPGFGLGGVLDPEAVSSIAVRPSTT